MSQVAMDKRWWSFAIVVAVLAVSAKGQNSSLLWQPRIQPVRPNGVGTMQSYGAVGGHVAHSPYTAMPPSDLSRPATRAIEQASLFALSPLEPRKFKVNDLITIIVRQQKKYEADGKLDTKKQWDINGKLEEWFRFHPGGRLGTDVLSNGKPGFDFKFENRLKTDAESEREDKFITRIQGRIIDVKPNGNLAIEATVLEEHDDERFSITLTGVCRSKDITADNSILSTQIAEMTLIEKNHGAVRDSTRRGWIPLALDWLRPF